MKTVKTRDAATAALRKLGINSRDYNLFIEKTDGGFVVKTTLAAAHLKAVTVDSDKPPDPVAEPQPPAVKAKKAKKVKPDKQPRKIKLPKPERVTVSSIAEGLILAGKTNPEVWAIIKERFKLDDTKKSYPSWYRCRLRRKGIIKE